MNSFLSILDEYDASLWGYHFKVPTEIAGKYIDRKNRRIICTINGKVTFHCALMPSPNGFFILINKKIRKELGLLQGEQAELLIEKDKSKYGMPLSKEFEAILNEDEEADHYFEQLSPGKQRSLIHMVNKIKSPELRLNRSLAILEYLVEEKGILDYKGLNEKIKTYSKQEGLNRII